MYNKLFRTADGKIVIGQRPNWPIVVWAAASVAGYLIKSQPLNTLLQSTATLALLIWAGMEIFQGVNLFRRILGTVVALYMLYGVAQMLL